jgi:flagellar motor switch protein FliN/FliY
MSDESDNQNDNENDASPEQSNDTNADTGDVSADDLAADVAAGVEEASSDDEAVTDEWAAAMAEDPTAEAAGDVGDEWADAMAEDDSVQQAPLDALTDDSKPTTDDLSPELDVILDIPVSISMEVGRTEIPIRNLLQLNQGSVVELDRLAGEPLDVLVNGTLIAHGEVVMVNDKFGIRLTDVVSQSERIQRLR